jgi:GH24 family phage-related lysozyme (muramidase)
MLEQYVWPTTVLLICAGSFTLIWRALSIAKGASDTAHQLATLAVQLGMTPPREKPSEVPAPSPEVGKPSVPPTPSPTPAPKPAPPPTPTLATSQDVVVDQHFIDYVKGQEGFSSKPYWDYKQWTSGYGTKAKSKDEVIDREEAEKRLRSELAYAVGEVKKFIPDAPIGVQQGMADAIFNLGEGWEHQTLGTLLKEGKYDEAAAHLAEYDHAGNPPQVLEALKKRRLAEGAMFKHPM